MTSKKPVSILNPNGVKKSEVPNTMLVIAYTFHKLTDIWCVSIFEWDKFTIFINFSGISPGFGYGFHKSLIRSPWFACLWVSLVALSATLVSLMSSYVMESRGGSLRDRNQRPLTDSYSVMTHYGLSSPNPKPMRGVHRWGHSVRRDPKNFLHDTQRLIVWVQIICRINY